MLTYFLDRMSILKPPALNIAAEEPVGVAILQYSVPCQVIGTCCEKMHQIE